MFSLEAAWVRHVPRLLCVWRRCCMRPGRQLESWAALLQGHPQICSLELELWHAPGAQDALARTAALAGLRRPPARTVCVRSHRTGCALAVLHQQLGAGACMRLLQQLDA